MRGFPGPLPFREGSPGAAPEAVFPEEGEVLNPGWVSVKIDVGVTFKAEIGWLVTFVAFGGSESLAGRPPAAAPAVAGDVSSEP